MTPRRAAKFQKVVAQRQGNLTIILENVHDTHNVSAVLRSCDSVGIYEIFVLYTEEERTPGKFKLGKRSSMGTRKWVDVHYYTDIEACFAHVRQRHDQILCAHVSENTSNLYDLDLCESVALLFGNEHDGVSDLALEHADGSFLIPQMGMAESLNISVACAVSLYEACRQRSNKGLYQNNTTTSTEKQQALLEEYLERHKNSTKNKHPRIHD